MTESTDVACVGRNTFTDCLFSSQPSPLSVLSHLWVCKQFYTTQLDKMTVKMEFSCAELTAANNDPTQSTGLVPSYTERRATESQVLACIVIERA